MNNNNNIKRANDFLFKSFALFLLIFVCIHSVSFLWNELITFPLGKKVYNNNWLLNDFNFTNNVNHGYIYNYFIGFLLEYLDPGAVAIIGRIICYFIFSIAIQYLFSSIQINFIAGFLILSMFLFNQSLVAEEWILNGSSAKTISYAFVILSIALAMHKKYIYSFLCIGFAITLHVLVGFYSLICLLMGILFTQGYKHFITTLKRYSIFFIISGSWGFYIIFKNTVLQKIISSGDIISDVWKTYVIFRHPHHLYPPSWSNDYIIYLIIFSSIFIIAIKKLNIKYKLLSIFALSTECLFLLGLLLSYLGEIEYLRFYLFRVGDVFIPLIAYILIGVIIDKLYKILATNYPFHIEFIFKNKLHFFLLYLIITFSFIFNLYIYNPIYNSGSPDILGQHKIPNHEMYDWIKNNTLPESTFITKPSDGRLSLFTNRNNFITYSPVPFTQERIKEWKKRIDLLDDYENMNENDILAIKEQYSVQYLITKNKSLQFEKVFDNSNLIIYKI